MNGWFTFNVDEGHIKCKDDTLVLYDDDGQDWTKTDQIKLENSMFNEGEQQMKFNLGSTEPITHFRV